MRTQVFVYDALGRDVSWITQEMCEDFAVADKRGDVARNFAVGKACRGDMLRVRLMMDVLRGNPDIEKLQHDLIAEFGEEVICGKPASRTEQILAVQRRLEAETDGKAYAALLKELRELQGWTNNLRNNGPTVVVNTTAGKVDKATDAREAERIAMEIFG